MMKTTVPLVSFLLLLCSCAMNVPVAVSCPVLPPLPAVLLEPVSTEPALSLQYENWIKDFKAALIKAVTQ